MKSFFDEISIWLHDEIVVIESLHSTKKIKIIDYFWTTRITSSDINEPQNLFHSIVNTRNTIKYAHTVPFCSCFEHQMQILLITSRVNR